MPTPNRTSTSPPRSPKRKRSEAQTAVPTAEYSDEPFPGSSPREQVAEKLQELNIHQATPARLPANQRRQLPRKRLKRNPGLAELAALRVKASVETPERTKHDVHEPHEGGETPHCRTQISDSLSREHSVAVQTRNAEQHLPKESVGEHPLASTEEAIDHTERSLSPLPLREDLTPDQAALTWQEDEITGHEIDTSSGDDGEGINGVGFKPTVAMAYARQQKRKQQVNEWKAREAREARQKRMERRRGGAQPDVSLISHEREDSKLKRIVRFAED